MKINNTLGYIVIEGDGYTFETYNLEPNTTRLITDLHLKWKEERIEKACIEAARTIKYLGRLIQEPPSLKEEYLEGR